MTLEQSIEKRRLRRSIRELGDYIQDTQTLDKDILRELGELKSRLDTLLRIDA